MLREFAAWLAATPLSHTLQEVTWIVPASQSLHIMALAVVFSSALMINLRLLGLGAGGRGVSQLAGLSRDAVMPPVRGSDRLAVHAGELLESVRRILGASEKLGAGIP